MKKKIHMSIIFMMGIIFVFFSGCSYIQEVNNEPDSINSFSVEYKLEELEEYFDGCNALIPDYFGGGEIQIISLKDVDQRFPVEDIRPWGYTFYRVTEGGRYYVFWSERNVYEDSRVTDDSAVMFTTYIPASPKDVSLFDSLEPGVSTAKDVEAIDPYVEMSFTRSTGVYSYSFLNNEELLEIEYYEPEDGDIYEDLVVKEMTVVPRLEYQAALYSLILPEDLP